MKKVLRAIGGFFARIGRWIAQTAWIQPLLIVGGIFAVIFSIPYIKTGIEGLVNKDTGDTQMAYYTSKKIDLTNAEKGESQADKLFDALESKDYDTVRNEFGEKFFLTFARESCSSCKECVDGFKCLESKFYEYGLDKDNAPAFKLYTIMVDDMISDSTSEFDGKYRAKFVFENHQELLDDVVSEYTEGSTSGEYALLKNVSTSNKTSMINSIEKLQNAIDNNGEGLDVPTTFLVDLTALDTVFNVNGISEIFFNYTSLITDKNLYSTVNYETKGQFMRDAWSYAGLFDANFQD